MGDRVMAVSLGLELGRCLLTAAGLFGLELINEGSGGAARWLERRGGVPWPSLSHPAY